MVRHRLIATEDSDVRPGFSRGNLEKEQRSGGFGFSGASCIWRLTRQNTPMVTSDRPPPPPNRQDTRSLQPELDRAERKVDWYIGLHMAGLIPGWLAARWIDQVTDHLESLKPIPIPYGGSGAAPPLLEIVVESSARRFVARRAVQPGKVCVVPGDIVEVYDPDDLIDTGREERLRRRLEGYRQYR